MVDDVRRRSACDRCHSQKLRCPRRPGVAVCDRCLKARKSCVYSPFRQKKGPGGNDGELSPVSESLSIPTKDGGNSSKEGNSDLVNASKRKRYTPKLEENTLDPSLMFDRSNAQIDAAIADGMNLDFAFLTPQEFSNDCAFGDLNLNIQDQYPFNFNPMSPLLRDEGIQKRSGFPRLESPPAPTPPEPKSLPYHHNLIVVPESTIYQNTPVAISWKYREEQAIPLESYSKCVQRLSELSTELYVNSNTIPPLSIHDPDTPEDELEQASNPVPNYRLDETLRLTQEVIKIYPSVLSLCSPCPGKESPRNNCTSSNPSPPSTIDHSSVLLALSCHLRLIGIYDKLFAHMDVCIDGRNAGKPLNKNRAQLTAPPIKIGSFTPPQSTAVPMQMLLLIQLASQLSSYISDLVAQVRSSGPEGLVDGDRGDESNRAGFALALAAAENVMGKANNMAQQLSSMRHQMLSQGMLA